MRRKKRLFMKFYKCWHLMYLYRLKSNDTRKLFSLEKSIEKKIQRLSDDVNKRLFEDVNKTKSFEEVNKTKFY